MKFTKKQLEKIYTRTAGYCHLCHKKIALTNYGDVGARGAWEVDHSVASFMGGTNHSNNLYASCIPCNRSKGILKSRKIRKMNGKTRVPLSPPRRADQKFINGAGGAILGGAIGSILGPLGLIVGTIAGAKIGADQNPDW